MTEPPASSGARPPVIGITADVIPVRHRRRYSVYHTYAAAVRRAGGFPVGIFPDDPSGAGPVLERVQGLLLPGGDDLHPRHWGEEEVHPAVTLSAEEKSLFELELARRAVAAGIPLLGVCLGMQTLNVALGGTILQHLDPDRSHGTGDGRRAEENCHPVEVAAGTRLARILRQAGLGAPGGGEGGGEGEAEGEPPPLRIEVNSGHHQGVGTLGRSLRACARSRDGVIEALEPDPRAEAAASSFLLGVQWHPEERPEDPVSRTIFRSLVAAASSRPD